MAHKEREVVVRWSQRVKTICCGGEFCSVSFKYVVYCQSNNCVLEHFTDPMFRYCQSLNLRDRSICFVITTMGGLISINCIGYVYFLKALPDDIYLGKPRPYMTPIDMALYKQHYGCRWNKVPSFHSACNRESLCFVSSYSVYWGLNIERWT